jgi:argininosuccinate lyase
MPQKKNPMTLEHVKGKAAHLEAFFVSVFSVLKNIPFTHCRDSSTEAMRFVWTALQEFEADLALMNVTIKTLTVKKDRMLQNAIGNFCTVTELANYLVRHDGISFRSAHNVVAMLVAFMQEHKKLANEITANDIDPICRQLLGHGTTLTDELIQEALDPAKNAQAKKTIGGANRDEVTRQLNRLQRHLNAHQGTLEIRSGQVSDAKTNLEATVKSMIGS